MIALNWAKTLGWRSAEPFYKALAIAILVEAFGVGETAKHIGQNEWYVEQFVELHSWVGMPRVEMDPAVYAKCLRKLLRVYSLEELSQRINMPVQEIQERLRKHPE